MNTLIVGMGEVGRALQAVLSPHYKVYPKDLADATIPDGIEMMHVCIRHSDRFCDIVRGYAETYKPKLIDICTTVPPGTTGSFGSCAVHSTTRGLHPNLALGLKTITKHIGGPCSEAVADYFRVAGVRCVTHRRAVTTELAHLLNNIAYGTSLMFADEAAAICRQYGVDYSEAVMHYTRTNNEGFRALDHDSKCRMVLTPPGGRIGGHCVTQAARMLAPTLDCPAPQIGLLAKYGLPQEDKA